MTRKLTGQALADALAKHYRVKFEGGSICGIYLGGGWVEVQGSGIPAHPDLRDQYPKGWSMLDRFRSGEARSKLAR